MAEISMYQGFMEVDPPSEDTFADIYVIFRSDDDFLKPIVLNIEADLACDPREWTLYQVSGGFVVGEKDIDQQLGYIYDDKEIEYMMNLPVTEWKWNA